jgi:hypothetical protein
MEQVRGSLDAFILLLATSNFACSFLFISGKTVGGTRRTRICSIIILLTLTCIDRADDDFYVDRNAGSYLRDCKSRW